MNSYKIYEDISKRTSGDIYMGVVGPVRCGKSTFITSFMHALVLPHITKESDKTRTLDELPQSADGKGIMTTQPHFVPKEGVNITVSQNVNLKIRLVDCVGFSISGAEGLLDGEKPRLVKTPWSEKALPFEEAAEIGTRRVINEHSTVAVCMTTDGSFGDIDRDSYVEAEEKTIRELKASQKPFVVLLNTKNPQSEKAKNLCESLSKKYGVSVLAISATNLSTNDIDSIFAHILEEFPLLSLGVQMPNWLRSLPFDDELIQEVVFETKNLVKDASKIGDIVGDKKVFENSENFETTPLSSLQMGDGTATLKLKPKENLFYKVLSKECGEEITNDFMLVGYIKRLSEAKREYDKIKEALEQVKETGYGVVSPKMEEMTLEEPEIVKQGSKYGVRLKASAPSLHIMQVDVKTEISPIVGSEQQSEDLVKYLLGEFESNPTGIWETNMFGKNLHELMNEGLNKKILQMPPEAQKKMRKTLSRIVNEGKGGIICILL